MLAVAGGKGGCGKTTTALGLALAAGRRGRAALAVDADVDMPDLHHVAGIGRRPAEPGADAAPDRTARNPDATDRRSASAAARPVPGRPGVAVVPAPRTADGVDAVLARCRGTRDLVVVDCPAGAGPDAAGPMRAADRTLVVTTPEPACLRDVAKTAAMSRAVGTPVAGAVVTRAARPPDGVERLLEAPAVAAVPPVEAPLRDRAARAAYDRTLRTLRSHGRDGIN